MVNGKTQKGCQGKIGKMLHLIMVLCFCICLFVPDMICLADATGKVTAASAKIRDKASADGAVIGSVKQNGSVDICGQETDGNGTVWYQVYVDANTKGFIRSDLVEASGTVPSGARPTTNSSSTQNTDSSSSVSVTSVDSSAGKVVTDNVRIRSSASTDSGVVATAKKGLSVTVTGKASGNDGKEWFEVTFKNGDEELKGFIRSDLVTFGDVEQDASTTEITGTVSDGEGDSNVENEENLEQEQQEQQEAENAEQNNEEQAAPEENSATSEVTLMNSETTPYVLPAFEQVVLNWKDQQITAWKNGEFYLFYANVNGSEGWYLYDQTQDVYERYVYETADANVPKGTSSGSMVAMISMGIIIALLLGVIGVMFMKMRNMFGGSYHDDEDDDYNEDEDMQESDEFAMEEDFIPMDDEPKVKGKFMEHKAEKVKVRSTRVRPSMDMEEEEMEEQPRRENRRRPTRQEEQAQNRRPVREDSDMMDAPRGRRPENRQDNRQPRRPDGSQTDNRRVRPEGNRPTGTRQNPNGQSRRNDVSSDRVVVRTSDDMMGRRNPAYQGGANERNNFPRENRRPNNAGGNVRTRRVQPPKQNNDDMEFIDL